MGDRENRIEAIELAREGEVWRREVWGKQESTEKKKRRRDEELRKLELFQEAKEKIDDASRAASKAVRDKLAVKNTRKVHELPPGEWKLLGGKKAQTFEIVVLEGADGDQHAVWATKGLRAAAEVARGFLKRSANLYWHPTIGDKGPFSEDVLLSIEPTQEGQEGQKIAWFPVAITKALKMHITRFREKVEEEEKKMENSWDQHVFAERYQPPKNKDCTKAADLQPGDCIAYGFSEILFRNSWRTILYLLPAEAEGNPTTNVETSVYGHFLQKELDAPGDL